MSSSFASVLLPVRCPSPSFIRTCQSVLSSQAVGELIIIDDSIGNSSLELPTSIVEPRVRLLRNSRTSGISGSLNTGIINSRFNFIARIDDGDMWLDPSRVLKAIYFLLNNPNYDLICSSMYTQSGAMLRPELSYHNSLPTPFIRVPHPTWVLKKSSVKHLYREINVLRFEDYVFLLDNVPVIYALPQVDTFYDESSGLNFKSELCVSFKKSKLFLVASGASFLSIMISASYVFLRTIRLLLTRKKVRS